VAIKVFQPQPGNDTVDAMNRFLREGAWASRVTHPNAVEVLAYGISAEEIPYLVMELLTGRTLAEEVRQVGRLTLDRCVEILMPVCAVLEAAHVQGIAHRDIKPGNIFLHREGVDEIVKLIDFGLAKLAAGATVDWIPGSFGETGDHLTPTGQLLGTPLYMAPERLAGARGDGRADVYSLGVVLYILLCGTEAFDLKQRPTENEAPGGSAPRWRRHDPLRPVRQLRPDVPEAVEILLVRMLDPNPAERPQLPAISQALRLALTARV
jgi:serine/threonine protein kinase